MPKVPSQCLAMGCAELQGTRKEELMAAEATLVSHRLSSFHPGTSLYTAFYVSPTAPFRHNFTLGDIKMNSVFALEVYLDKIIKEII